VLTRILACLVCLQGRNAGSSNGSSPALAGLSSGLHSQANGGVDHVGSLGSIWLTKEAFQVAVDIREEDDAFYVDAEVPGLSAEDIKVDVEKNILTLSGERKVEKEETKDKYRRVERQYGSFSRSFSLPETVNTDDIRADLKDGILELRLPKKEAPTPKKISVNVGS